MTSSARNKAITPIIKKRIDHIIIIKENFNIMNPIINLIHNEIIVFLIFNIIYLILEISFKDKCYIKDRQKILLNFMS